MSYIDAVQTKNDIVSWRREEGHLVVENYPKEDYMYLFIPDNTGEGDTQSIYGERMKKVFFDTKYEMNQFKDRFDHTFEADVPVVNKFLIDEYSSCDTEAPVNTLYFDIEVDFDLGSGSGYPTPDNPFGEINAISCFDTYLNKYIMYIPDHLRDVVSLSDDEYDVDIIWTTSEAHMLSEFAENIDHVDILTAWHGDGFDIPYIFERALINFEESKAISMFCRGGFEASRRDFVDDYGKDSWEYTLVGRHHIDMMKLFKKFMPGERESFSLDAVCKDELGESKIEYEDDLGKLYRDDPQTFFEYSLHDSRLLKKLDDKHQIIKLGYMVARMCCVRFSDVYGAVKPIETAIIKYAHENSLVLPNKKDNHRESIEGAIVYHTIKGRHGWVSTIDLAGLYPSVIRMLGLSNETMVMQLEGGYEDYISVMSREDKNVTVDLVRDENKMVASATEVYEIIRENGYTISANGTIFDGTVGVIDGFLKHITEKRAEYKKLLKETDDENKANVYDLYQKVMKLIGNSSYGIILQPSFRLYDPRLAQSITLTGQVISKWQAYKGNDIINGIRKDAA